MLTPRSGSEVSLEGSKLRQAIMIFPYFGELVKLETRDLSELWDFVFEVEKLVDVKEPYPTPFLFDLIEQWENPTFWGLTHDHRSLFTLQP